MNKNLIFLEIILAILFSNALPAQNCVLYNTKNCRVKEKEKYRISGQSHSGFYKKGRLSEIPFLAYGGNKYKITVCFEKKLRFVQLKLKDGETNKIIYDNEEDNYSTHKTFTISNTKKLIIQIIIVGPQETNTNKYNSGCVGILIEYKKFTENVFIKPNSTK